MRRGERILIDEREDKEQATRWLKAEADKTWQSLEELAHFAALGVSTCEDYCYSRETHGEDACFCIRARFASPDHYFLYLEMRKIAKKLTAFAFIAQTVKTGDRNE